MKLPEPSASAAEVRKYLAQALKDRGVENEHATLISRKWNIGSGKELRAYSLPMYQKIFGPDQEEVWSMYMAVQPEVIRERQANELTRQQRVLILLAVLVATFAFPIFAFSTMNIGLQAIAFLAAVSGALVSIFLTVMLFEEDDPEKLAEQDLRNAKPAAT